MQLQVRGMGYAPLKSTNAETLMKTLIMACFALLTIGCQTSRNSVNPIVYLGGDGSSHEQAIIIREAPCREAGVLAEQLWLNKVYPGHQKAQESALTLASRQYAVFEIATAEGQTRKVYFDTTEFTNK